MLSSIKDDSCPHKLRAQLYAHSYVMMSEPPQHMAYGFGKQLLDTLCNRCDKLPLCMHSHELYEALDKKIEALSSK